MIKNNSEVDIINCIKGKLILSMQVPLIKYASRGSPQTSGIEWCLQKDQRGFGVLLHSLCHVMIKQVGGTVFAVFAFPFFSGNLVPELLKISKLQKN